MLAIAGYPSINGYHTHANTAANVSSSKEQRKGNATADDQQLEAACREWVQEVAGVAFAEGSSLQEELKSGVVLCKLGNAIRPGVCLAPSAHSCKHCAEGAKQTKTRMETGTRSRLTRMETLASYLTSCDILGVPKHRQFQTVTLFQDHDFVHLENIARFLAACSVLGVPVQHLFQTVALYENRDIMQVLNNLQALGRAAQREPNYRGPPFG
tara:strand:- start:969 stop:1604 length:636 start_codon:yes stop_codon:yes gene_type:complete